MRGLWWPLLTAAVGLAVLMPKPSVKADMWTPDFLVTKDELISTGRNSYFILEPGYTLVLEGDGECLTVTVLNEIKQVLGVETRTVEERHTEKGKLVEVSRNYLAISKRTNDVFYFGEDDVYKDGQVISHGGSWRAGAKNGRFGLIMPGKPSVNTRYRQEIASQVATDRATIVSMDETVEAPAGEFTNCVTVKETTLLEPGITEHKYSTPGVGLVKDGPILLVKHEKAEGRGR